MDWLKIFDSREEARKKLVMGKPHLLLIGSTRICLILFEDKIFAIEDRCSHNGESLSKGKVNFMGEIVCPWHSYRFNLQTGREIGERSKDVITFALKEEDTGVFIYI